MIDALESLKEPAVKPPNDDDEDTLFMKSLIPQLKRLNPRNKAMARIEIQQVLNKFEFNFAPNPVNPPPFMRPNVPPVNPRFVPPPMVGSGDNPQIVHENELSFAML